MQADTETRKLIIRNSILKLKDKPWCPERAYLIYAGEFILKHFNVDSSQCWINDYMNFKKGEVIY